MKTTRERIFFGAVLVFCLCGLYVFLSLNGLSYRHTLQFTPLANITVVPGSQIPTPDFGLLATITPTSTISPASITSSGIQPGVYVQITGTGGSGLNIRTNPDLSSNKNFIANESEVFLVISGPVVTEEYIWWQLSAPYDDSRQGWAVEEYLHLLEP